MIANLLLWSLAGLGVFYLAAVVLGGRPDLRPGRVFAWAFVIVCGPLAWLAMVAFSQGYRMGMEDAIDATSGEAPDFVVTEVGEILAEKKGGPKS